LEAAKQEYFATSGVYGPYEEKVLEGTALYGIPTWTIGGGHAHKIRTPPLAPSSGSAATTKVVQLDYTTVGTLGRVQRAVVDGMTFDPLVTANRPILPRFDEDVSRVDRRGRLVPAHGVLITALTDGTSNPSFDPVVPTAALQPTGSTTENPFGAAALPTRIARINTYTDPWSGSLRQRLVVVPAQYHADVAGDGGVGYTRTYSQIGYATQYSTSTDFTEPILTRTGATQSADTITFTTNVAATSSVRRVVVMYTDGSAWHTVDLHAANGVWIGSFPSTSNHHIEFFVQALDAHGNVGITNNKARNFPLSW
jgi:hypothetical protein